VRRFALHAILIGWTLVSVLPVLWMLSASVQSTEQIYSGVSFVPETWEFDNYRRAWQDAEFDRYMGNSVLYTVTITSAVVLFASMAAYAFARLRFPAKNVIYSVLLAFIFVPMPAAFIPLYVILVRLGLVDTRLGYILPMINAHLPVAIFLLRRFFESLPREVEEAALVDGAGRIRIYAQIALPLAKPAIATITILTVLGVWNEFTLALIVFTDNSLMPLQVGLQVFQGTYFSQYGLMMAAIAITTVPVIVVYLCFQRFIIRGVMAGAVKQ